MTETLILADLVLADLLPWAIAAYGGVYLLVYGVVLSIALYSTFASRERF